MDTIDNEHDEARPPKDTIIKPKSTFARPPKETIKPKSLNNQVEKHVIIWALAYVFIIEILSFILWDSVNYKDFYYPLFVQIGFLLLLINFYALKSILKYCIFKKASLLILIFYFVLEIIAMIFKIEIIFKIAEYFFLPFGFILLIFSIKKTWKRTN